MKKHLLCWLICSFVFIQNDQLKAQQPGEIIPGEIIVQLRQTDDLTQLEKSFSSVDLQVMEMISKRLHLFLVGFNPVKVDGEFMLSSLKNSPVVLKAQYNHRVELRESIENWPDDTNFGQQWDMHNTGENGGVAGADIDALRAWDITTGGVTALGDTIVVAVIDGGCSINHADLNLFKNRNEIMSNGIDDDENGYIDDYHGWNAYNNSGTIPDHAHGTHVSGSVGARGNNGIGVSGVNWNVKVLPIAGSSTVESVVIKAYAYAYEMRALYDQSLGQKGAFIVATNSSFGVNNGQPEDYPVWEAMYDSLGSLGILNAGATANANVNVDVVGDIPTAFDTPWLITVTNTTNKDEKFSVAAYGTNTIDLGAPGTQIYSTKPNNSYGFSTGTSMACPHVAGATALLFSAVDSVFMTDYKANPAQKILEIKQYLLDGTDSLTGLQGITVSGGRLNIYKSLMLLQHPIDLTLDKDSLSFVLPENSVGLKDFVVKNKGVDTVNLRITVLDQPAWLILIGEMFSIPPSDSAVVSVSVSGLEVGQFETNLQLFANETLFGYVLVKTLVYTPEILLSNDSIVFEMPVNTLHDTVITIKNPMPADCFVQMTTENMSPWMHVEPDTSTIAANDSIQLIIDFDSHGLAVGDYSELLNIEAGIAGKHPLYVGIQVYDPSSVFESHLNQVRVNSTPNPFSENIFFNISLTVVAPFDFVIYDNMGQIIHNQTVIPDNKLMTIEWNGRTANDVLCRAGSYYYSIKNDGRLMISGKILKQ